jgi:predicted amino acid dehydrogenase
MGKALYRIALDLLGVFMPLPQRPPYAFVFLIHMRQLDDIYRKFPFLKILPESWLQALTRHAWPITVSKITGLKEQESKETIPGWVICVPLTAKQMMEDRALALRHIRQAVVLAKNKGAKIIGLGALTGSLTRGGRDLKDIDGVALTTGHAYTVYNITQTLLGILDEMDEKHEESTLAIVGASGSIGSGVARLLCEYKFKELLLIDVLRKNENLNALVAEIRDKHPDLLVSLSNHIGEIKRADVIITATSAPEALIKDDDLKVGAIVIDDAQPSDIDSSVFKRDDVLVLEAGAVRTPGIQVNFDLDLKGKEDSFSCLAEVLIMASQRRSEHYVLGDYTVAHIAEISSLGRALGFSVAPFQNQYEIIHTAKIKKIKDMRRIARVA